MHYPKIDDVVRRDGEGEHSLTVGKVLVAEEASQQVLDVLDGRPARYAVNAPLLTPETARAIAPYLPLAVTLGRFYAQFARDDRRESRFAQARRSVQQDVIHGFAALFGCLR